MVGFKNSFAPAGATPEQKAEIVGWGKPDWDSEIEIVNTTGGFVYHTPKAGCIKINKASVDGGATAKLYKGSNNQGKVIATNLTTFYTVVSGSQFNGQIMFLLVPVDENEDYFFETSNISKIRISFVPDRG